MKDAVEVFDLYAEEYDRWFDSAEGKVLFKMEVEAVRLLMKGLEKPFLEVGVGTGRFAKELGIDYGIDPSQRALEIAERRGIKVKKAKGESLPFKDGSFGAVFLLFTICFVDDPEKVLSEAQRVLKKDGGLIVGIINRESSWGELYMKKKAEGHPIYKHAKFYSIDEIIEMVERAGMAIDGYSSTLCQPPLEMPYEVHSKLIKDAGFVCILAKN
ncbi:MAG: class I SAM-dependent methyltransferase [Nitrospirae bacterium]|nr:class I SAM-dependent methyltransferase [Nitrospirota bacterium]MCL5978108.1 class I SAM-dependent methyltransferase [Nitrospirota bacterium]